jgi:catechol 2,3-dioxygenase-like lactoylglutathione lyase family enzyme
MSNVIHVAPFVHVDNLDRALAFFTDIRGSETPFRVADHAYVQREGFRILQQTGDDGAPPAIGDLRTTSMFATSISSMQNSGRSLICCLKAMFTCRLTKSYGQRELLVLAPDGNLLAFGQAIAK